MDRDPQIDLKNFKSHIKPTLSSSKFGPARSQPICILIISFISPKLVSFHGSLQELHISKHFNFIFIVSYFVPNH